MVDPSTENTLLDRIVDLEISHVIWIPYVRPISQARDLQVLVERAVEVLRRDLENIIAVFVHGPPVEPVRSLGRSIPLQRPRIHEVGVLSVESLLLVHAKVV